MTITQFISQWVYQVILSNWVEVYSRILKTELNSSEPRGEDKLYDLRLLNSTYSARPNQGKPSHQTCVHLCCLILNKTMFQFMEGLTFTRLYDFPSTRRSSPTITRQHKFDMHRIRGNDTNDTTRHLLWIILNSLTWFKRLVQV